METTHIIAVVVVLVILVCLYWCYYKPQAFSSHTEAPQEPVKKVENAPQEELDWNTVLVETSLDPAIKDSHLKYVSTTRQYSSGSNFTSVNDDNTSDMYTNFLGFSRPRYIPVDPTARQVPGHDETVLKRNKHMFWR